MTQEYAWKDRSGETRLRGTIDPAPGGAQPGTATVRGPFSFAFNTAGLENGVAFYTPTVDDILLDLWVEIDTIWDAMASCDVAQFTGGATAGIFKNWNAAVAVDAFADTTQDMSGTLLRGRANDSSLGMVLAHDASNNRIVPVKFTTADPLKVVVSATGEIGGGDPGAAAGAAALYIVSATPVAF